ncbi:MAG: response regulator [Candidatus Sungbacteria bacterium]|nr:response regulator [Candidatus Sungbacteria bacterium]
MKKILFIEDEPALQRSLTTFLQEKGYQAISALDGDIGMRLARNEQPDLILLDIILPKKNGIEVLKDLRADERTSRIPVIMLTNLDASAEVERAIALGAATYLVKANYSPGEVIQKIEQALTNAPARPDLRAG